MTSVSPSVTIVSGASWASSTAAGLPPENASTPPRGLTITGSAGRTERTGPIVSASWEWKTTTRRVMPSVSSS
jgi:hypothetical protein